MSKGGWVLPLVIFAAIADGLLAGGNIDRLLVATPAWIDVGLNGWADFSRNADLGNGILVYPAMALGGTLAVVLAAAVFLLKGRTPQRATLPVVLSATLMLVALPFSLKATPYMLSLHSISDGDFDALGRAFAGAHYWGRLQSIAHLAAFGTELWAIVALARRADTEA